MVICSDVTARPAVRDATEPIRAVRTGQYELIPANRMPGSQTQGRPASRAGRSGRASDPEASDPARRWPRRGHRHEH